MTTASLPKLFDASSRRHSSRVRSTSSLDDRMLGSAATGVKIRPARRLISSTNPGSRCAELLRLGRGGGRSRGVGLVEVRFPRPAAFEPSTPPPPQLVGSPDDRREEGEHQQLARSERRSLERRLERWDVMIPASRGRGGRSIVPGSAGSRPSASAGTVSVPSRLPSVFISTMAAAVHGCSSGLPRISPGPSVARLTA